MRLYYWFLGNKKHLKNLHIFRTHCVHCGKHFWRTKKHWRSNGYRQCFYYCLKCPDKDGYTDAIGFSWDQYSWDQNYDI